MTDRNTGTRIDAPLTIFGTDDIQAGYTDQLQGAVQQFKDKPGRDDWTSKYKSRLFNTIAIVGKGENDYPSIYHWTGTKEDGSDGSWEFAGYFGGVVLADADGAIPALRATIVLGEDFAIQQAGDNGLGVLVQLSDELKAEIGKSGGSPLSVGQGWGKYQMVDDVTTIDTLYPLEINQGKTGPTSPTPGSVVMSIKPGVYERHHNEGYLAYFDNDEVILGKTVTDTRRGAIWPMSVAWGDGNADLYPELDTKSVTLQDATGDDPNVTGGVPIFCGLHIAFYGKAPDDGTVEFYLWDDNRDSALLNSAGQPIGYIHHFKSGDELKPITIGQVYIAKGAVKAQWRVKHTFTDDPLRFKDWAVGSSCMIYQILGKGEAISPALNEFQSVIEKPVRIMQKYYGQDFAANKWEYSFNLPRATIPANSGQDSVLGIDFENTTPLTAALENKVLNIKDDGTNMVLFNTGIELTPEDTRNLRGKAVTVSTQVLDRYGADSLVMFVYTGNIADVTRPILTGMHNMQYVLSAGWDAHDHAFLAEHAEGGFHDLTKSFVIPNQAEIVMFGVLPVEEQSPCDVSIKPMTISVNEAFTAYEVSIPMTGDQLMFKSVSSSFITYNKMWNIGTSKTNLPFGEKVNKVNNANVALNTVEDDSSTYNGGIELKSVASYEIEVWLNVVNVFKTKITNDVEISFWVEDVDGHEVPGSRPVELALKDGDYNSHVVHWSFIYDNKMAGTVLKLYGLSTQTKVAFLSSGTDNAAGVVINENIVP